MKEYILRMLENSKTLTLEEVAVQIVAAVSIGLVIYLSYWMTHTGTVYSKKFNVSLIMLTILTATVMAVIGNNVALSLGMVGALSIVRYRTAIKDSRDTAYIFWAIISGICCGAGDFMVGAMGSAAVFIVMMFLGRIKNDCRMLIVIKGPLELEKEIEAVIFSNFKKRAVLRVKNTTEISIEFIYEISKKVFDKANENPKSVIMGIYGLGNIEYVNVITQNDEIL